MEPTTPSTQGRFPGVMCQATASAVDRLKQGGPGDSLTRAQMEAIIGRPCGPQTPGYGNVREAIKHVEANYGVAWEWQRPLQAWVCLDDVGKVNATKTRIRRAQSAAKRAVRVAGAVDVRNLKADERRSHTLNLAMAGMTLLASSGAFRQRLNQLDGPSKPEMGKLLELMSPAKK